MGKRQDWSLTACVFLFLSLASQIHCSSDDEDIRVSVPLLRIRKAGVNGQTLKERDQIQKLPGQPDVNFNQYGGYVAINQTAGRFLYYYFVEAIKPTDTTPLVIWFNGGPGCSSIQSVLKSLGPFQVQSDGKTLYRNPYAWNNEANVLFLESPMGVGFSYSNTPIDMEEEAFGGDERTAEGNYMFLLNWLERFPEYKKRDIYITGQSYAGHYVPQLAQLILQRNNKNLINLRGVMIGNPSLYEKIDDSGILDYIVSHVLVPQEYKDERNKFCGGRETFDPKLCLATLNKISDTKRLLDTYNIYSPVCLDSTLTSKPKESPTTMKADPCIGHYVTAYLNTRKVQSAMHANTTKIPYAWQSCNTGLNNFWNTEHKEASMVPILNELTDKGVRVWLYSGDVDAVVPVTSTMGVLKSMNLTVEKNWRPWFAKGQLGGFTEDYKGNLKFVTVKGGGHAVPFDQPISALTLLTSFLRNTTLPSTR